MRFFHPLILVVLTTTAPVPAADPKPTPESLEFFEKHVRPVLVDKCVSCHGPKAQRGGLRMDSREAMLKGGDTGPALVVGDPQKSLIIQAVRRQGDLKMPPKDKDRLDEKSIAAISSWIQQGAVWPASVAARKETSSVELARKTHWAFRPVTRPEPPAVRQASLARTPLDRFLLAKLEEKQMSFSPETDRRTLIRRVTFDLTGLPPSPADVEAFVADPRADAYERVVDRLLADPAHGERWGRHWLDVARYADTKGYVFVEERRYPYSHTYRDYVVSAFNSDLPYDRFIVEQIAADQLPLGEDRGALAAMGFLTLGRRFLNNIHDIIDDRIDVMSRGLMGLTVGCARCHDHKYDPVPMRDYYSLHGVFASSQEPGELPLLRASDQKRSGAFEQELRKRQGEMDAYLARSHADRLTQLRESAADYMLAASRTGAGRAEGILPRVRERWRAYLEQAKKKNDPVLSAWLAFVDLPEKTFATEAAALATRVTANQLAGKPVNPRVAKAFAGAPPATLNDVAERYRKLFHEANEAWKQAQAKNPAVTRLDDADLEAIRQVLSGKDAPGNITLAEARMFLNRAEKNKLSELKKRVDQWQATGPGNAPRGMVLVDLPSPVQPRVLLRGNPGNPGVTVPRQFLEIVAPERKPFAKGSGRLELAQAIASPDNPLTSRVMANRVWMHHFGKPIVTTPGDFGIRGEPPTHPELLDWLASELVRTGWSLKHLHRVILLSAAYRQGSGDHPTGLASDPENTLLWRMNRRRLEFEPLRDSLLAVSGTLDRQMGGPAVEITKSPFPLRRSVYAFIERQNLPGVFRTFDLASPDVSTPRRHSTTVPQQALFLMNSPFVQEQSRALAQRLLSQGEASDEARVQQLYHLAFGRAADPEEVALARTYLRDSSRTANGSTPWERYVQVVLLANEFAFVD